MAIIQVQGEIARVWETVMMERRGQTIDMTTLNATTFVHKFNKYSEEEERSIKGDVSISALHGAA